MFQQLVLNGIIAGGIYALIALILYNYIIHEKNSVFVGRDRCKER